MTTALIGLLGVVVGVLLGGGVQILVAKLDRRAESKRAARLLFGDAHFAENALANAAEGIWWQKANAPSLDGWRRYREALAGAMDGPAFQSVDGAFQRIANIEVWRETGEVGDLEVDAAEALEQMREARGLLLLEGFSGEELARMQQEMEQGSGGSAD